MSGLRCRGLVAGYGTVGVVQPLDLDVAPGSVMALLGPNGSGKTTLMNTLAGLLRSLDGEIRVNDEVIRPGRPKDASSAGLVLVADDRALFKSLTVSENLQVAARRSGTQPETMLEMFPALEKRWSVRAGDLSGGEQQMLAVARGLVRQPKVLLIDEMSMGLAPIIVRDLLPVVGRVAEETGAAVVLVEQHVGLALEVADEATVLVHGEVKLQGSAAELAADMSVLESAYMGS
ncbi:MAG: ABC transporter ATP-binding protein [bacterium]|nr:ABC transporter ATP-binding protein [bacterium]MCY4134856.1 ABC transporter ATP-binding protein [bacterium]